VKKLFSIDNITLEKIKNKYPKIFDSNSISIHIRRGDYLNFYDIHPVISLDYVKKCLGLFSDISNIFVFSDDKEWVKNNFNFCDYTLISLNYDYEELWAMSLCSNNIMSNSSFSWWSAYLNNNINKKCICPDKWFGKNGVSQYDDIFSKEFIKINTKIIDSKIFPL
jgi:hypothetical protein